MPLDIAGSTCRSKRRSKRLRRAVLGCCVGLLVAVVMRNWIARQAIERLGSHWLGAPITLQWVDVGLPWIRIEGLRIAEQGDCDETLLTVQRIAITASLGQGWREGVWLRAVRIDQPTLRLRLRQDGGLISRLPPLPGTNSTPRDRPFPLALLNLHGGRLVVEQAGTVDEVASGLELQLVGGREIALQAKLAQVLGGQLRLQAKLSADDPDPMAKIDWKVAGVQLGRLRQPLGLETLQGEFDLRGSAAVRLPQLADIEAWQAFADVELRQCASDGWQLADTTASFRVANGAVRFSLPVDIESASREIAGRAELDAVVGLQEGRDLLVRITSRLQLQHQISSGSEGSPGHTGGTFSLRLDAKAPRESILSAESWNANWILNGHHLRIANEQFDDFQCPGRVTQGRLEIPEFAIAWRDVSCRIGASGQFNPVANLGCYFRVETLNLADVAKLAEHYSQSPLPLDGQAELKGHVRLGVTGDWTAHGDVQLRRTRYQARPLGDASLNWQASREGVKLTSESVDFLGGSYELAAQLQELDWTRATVTAQAENIQLKRLVEVAGLNVAASGTLAGQVRLSSLGDWSTLSAVGQMQGEKLRIAGLPVTLGHNELLVRDGKLVAQVVGECCEGKAQCAATAVLAELVDFANSESPPTLDSLPFRATATLSGVSLGRLADGLFASRNHQRIGGRLSASFVRDTQLIADSQIGIGSITIEHLSSGAVRLSDRIHATVAVRSDRLRLEKLDGRLFDGQLQGQGELELRRGRPRGRLNVVADRVNLRRASSAWQSLAASGTASIRVQARLDGNLTGRADLSVDNAAVSNLLVRHARVPIDWDYSPRSATMRWNCRGAAIELGDGKALLTSRGDFAGGLSTATLIRLNRIDTAKLLQTSSLGLGVIDGQVTINARKATSVDQLQGKFDLDLTKVQPLQVPILDKLPQMVQLPELLQTDALDDGGYLYGSFGGGTVRLEQLALWQNRIQILAEGQATLAGRLNFMVTASTLRGGPADQWLALAQSPLMLAAPAPVALLAQANEILKNRVVHVAVGGTATRPVLQLQPARQLAQQALRFFIRGATGAQLADAADWNQRPRRR